MRKSIIYLAIFMLLAVGVASSATIVSAASAAPSDTFCDSYAICN